MADDWDPMDEWRRLFETTGDEWSLAFRAMLVERGSNPKLLAELLRSGKAMPEDACKTLAELIDPRTPDYLGYRLTLVENKSPRVKRSEENIWSVYARYVDFREQGYTEADAADRTADLFGIKDATTVHRKRRLAEQMMLRQGATEWALAFARSGQDARKRHVLRKKLARKQRVSRQ